MIFDFDRCEGDLYNPVHIHMPADTFFEDQDTVILSSPSGVSVSPNNKFLYISRFDSMFQYDLTDKNLVSTKTVIGVYDGFQSPFSTYFFQQKLGPDGKIYMTAPNGVNYLHVIHKPNEKGVACDFEQHGVELPSQHSFSVPNAPHYDLFDVEGSICDTLGIDGSLTSSIPNNTIVTNLDVFPNPSSGQISINIPGKGTLRLLSTQGKILRTITIDDLSVTNITTTLKESGMYILQWIDNDGQIVAVDKFVIQK